MNNSKYEVRQQWNMYGADVWDVVRLDEAGKVTHRFYGLPHHRAARELVETLTKRYG